MKVGSVFSGVGGIDLGLERAGMEVVYQCEADKDARRVLARHWPEIPIHPDVVELSHAARGTVQYDLLCGGFPCQDYSMAGARSGLAGDRGALWWSMHRLAARDRPAWVLGENVPGLLTSAGGRDFLEIVRSLVQLGYGVAWATLDARFFGVAQRRRRLFVVGHLGGVPRPEVLDIADGVSRGPAPSRGARERAPSGDEGGPGIGGQRVITSGPRGGAEDGIAGTLVSRPGQRDLNRDQVITVGSLCASNQVGNQLVGQGQLVMSSLQGQATVSEGFSSTLNLMEAPITLDGWSRPRRLTPVEQERLQGFPDDWTRWDADGNEMSVTSRNRRMGNAVCVNVAEWIGHRIMEAHRVDLER